MGGKKEKKYEIIPSNSNVIEAEPEPEPMEAENSPREEFKSAIKEAIEETKAKNQAGPFRHKDC